MEIKTFFHQDTFTFSYIVYDKSSRDAVLIDPVLDYDQGSSTLSHDFADQLTNFIIGESLQLHWIIETHVHADHLTASQFIKEQFSNVKVGISERVTTVQKTFSNIYNLKELNIDGSQFDQLFKDNDTILAGNLSLKIIHTPGHTPACMSILIEDCLFTGDALFMPDFGTGRCDFPDGSASELYHSVHEKLYQLPSKTRVFVGHDYQPGGRALGFETTILESKNENIQLREGTSKEEFIEFRNNRDKVLKAPKLLLPSIQVNIQAGRLPKAEDNRTSYLKIPITIK